MSRSVLDPEEVYCIDERDGLCDGAVELRPSLTGTGTPISRCDFHWAKRLEWDAEHREKYPDTDVPPLWFDPLAAGERWNDDY